jgi:hypothetical protein
MWAKAYILSLSMCSIPLNLVLLYWSAFFCITKPGLFGIRISTSRKSEFAAQGSGSSFVIRRTVSVCHGINSGNRIYCFTFRKIISLERKYSIPYISASTKIHRSFLFLQMRFCDFQGSNPTVNRLNIDIQCT